MPKAADFLPIGTIIATAQPPTYLLSDWLLCDGSLIPSQYGELIALVGQNTPNLIGRTMIGAGTLASGQPQQDDGRAPQFDVLSDHEALQVGDTGGECAHTLIISELPQHRHPINRGNIGIHHRSFKGEEGSDCPFETNPENGSIGGTDPVGDNQRHYNVPPYYAVSYFIYAGQG